jgi:hypothetical protein
VHHPLIERLSPSQVEVALGRVEEAEVDEGWSFVGKKQGPRWRWHAIDHHTGQVLAYVCGRRKDEVVLQLKAVLLYRHQILQRIDPRLQAGRNHTGQQTGNVRTMLGRVEEGVLALANAEL